LGIKKVDEGITLTQVDKLEDGLQIEEGHIAKDKDGVLPGADPFQEHPEVGGAGAQHYLVRLQVLALRRQGHVNKVLRLQDVLEGGGEGELVVVPFQAELVAHDDDDSGGGRLYCFYKLLWWRSNVVYAVQQVLQYSLVHTLGNIRISPLCSGGDGRGGGSQTKQQRQGNV
jgi:hypothetical protein